MPYIPNGQRLLVKKIRVDLEKTGGGLYIDADHTKTESKNNLIKAVIEAVGIDCKNFTKDQIGLVVLIHEVGGVPMHGQDPMKVIVHETDIWAYSDEPLSEDDTLTIADVHKESELSRLINLKNINGLE